MTPSQPANPCLADDDNDLENWSRARSTAASYRCCCCCCQNRPRSPLLLLRLEPASVLYTVRGPYYTSGILVTCWAGWGSDLVRITGYSSDAGFLKRSWALFVLVFVCAVLGRNSCRFLSSYFSDAVYLKRSRVLFALVTHNLGKEPGIS